MSSCTTCQRCGRGPVVRWESRVGLVARCHWPGWSGGRRVPFPDVRESVWQSKRSLGSCTEKWPGGVTGRYSRRGPQASSLSGVGDLGSCGSLALLGSLLARSRGERLRPLRGASGSVSSSSSASSPEAVAATTGVGGPVGAGAAAFAFSVSEACFLFGGGSSASREELAPEAGAALASSSTGVSPVRLSGGGVAGGGPLSRARAVLWGSGMCWVSRSRSPAAILARSS
jgi:hypothetical protein